MNTAAAAPQILTFAQADDQFPRHSEPALLERSDGSLLVIWQEYTASEHGGEDNAPNHLAAMVSRDGGRTWGEKRVVVEPLPGDVNVYSPNLVRLPDGDVLFLYFHYNRLAQGEPVETTAFVRRSSDEGETFGEPVLLWEREPLHFACSVARVLSDGRVILPIGRQMGLVWSKSDHEAEGVAVSHDGGRTWRIGATDIDLPLRGVMENHVAELRDGRLLMVMRTQLGSVFCCHSGDRGETWSKPQTTGLRAPESAPELINVPGGDLLLVWNESEYDPRFGSHYGKRSPLTVALSHDDGATWPRRRNVETDPERGFSNPVALVTREGKVVLFYWTCPYNTERWTMSVRRIDMRVAIFDLGWLQA